MEKKANNPWGYFRNFALGLAAVGGAAEARRLEGLPPPQAAESEHVSSDAFTEMFSKMLGTPNVVTVELGEDGMRLAPEEILRKLFAGELGKNPTDVMKRLAEACNCPRCAPLRSAPDAPRRADGTFRPHTVGDIKTTGELREHLTKLGWVLKAGSANGVTWATITKPGGDSVGVEGLGPLKDAIDAVLFLAARDQLAARTSATNN